MAKRANTRPAVDGVASVERSLQVLVAFRGGDGALELAELAERTGLVKSTIMRLAVSLENYGFLVRTVEGRYALGGEIVRLAGIYGEQYDLSREIMPTLEFLAREVQETATFWVREGDHRRCLYRVNSPLQLRLEIQPGTLRPMDKSSSATVLRNFGAITSSEPSGALPYYTAGATTPHVASLSVPIFGQNDQLVGSLSISGPDSRLNKARAKEIGPLLLQVGQQLSRRLGGRVTAPAGAKAAAGKTAAKAPTAAPARAPAAARKGRKAGA